MGGEGKQEDKHDCLENDHFLIYITSDDNCARGIAYEAATEAMRWESCAATHAILQSKPKAATVSFSLCVL